MFEKIIALGNLAELNEVDRILAVPHYVEFARELRTAGQKQEAMLFLNLVQSAVYEEVEENLSAGRPENALAVLDQIQNRPWFGRAPAEVKASLLHYQILIHSELRQWMHVLRALEALSVMNKDDRIAVPAGELAYKLKRMVFDWVAFDPATGKVRKADPEEFLDSDSILPERDRPVRKNRDPSFVYGMTSSAEDFADLAGAVVVAKESPEVEANLRDLILERINSGKLSLPVRFQLHMFADSFLDTKVEGSQDTLRKRLSDAISMRGGEIEERILIGFQFGVGVRTLERQLH